LAVAEARVADARSAAGAAVQNARSALASAKRTGEAHALLVALADSSRDVVKNRVESTVELAIQAVFGKSRRFRFEVEIKRGVVSMTPLVGYLSPASKVAPGEDPYQWMPLSEVGGGVVDIVAFAARVTLLSWYRPRVRRVIVADEPFRHVSNEYLPRVATMLKTLSESTGIQMIVVSHEPELASSADRVIRVTRRGAWSKAESEDRSPIEWSVEWPVKDFQTP
jgi:hypothetical protein